MSTDAALSGVEEIIEEHMGFTERYLRHQPGVSGVVVMGKYLGTK
jgi:hypothetical protein